jgi:hypothetical protein
MVVLQLVLQRLIHTVALARWLAKLFGALNPFNGFSLPPAGKPLKRLTIIINAGHRAKAAV